MLDCLSPALMKTYQSNFEYGEELRHSLSVAYCQAAFMSYLLDAQADGDCAEIDVIGFDIYVVEDLKHWLMEMSWKPQVTYCGSGEPGSPSRYRFHFPGSGYTCLGFDCDYLHPYIHRGEVRNMVSARSPKPQMAVRGSSNRRRGRGGRGNDFVPMGL